MIKFCTFIILGFLNSAFAEKAPTPQSFDTLHSKATAYRESLIKKEYEKSEEYQIRIKDLPKKMAIASKFTIKGGLTISNYNADTQKLLVRVPLFADGTLLMLDQKVLKTRTFEATNAFNVKFTIREIYQSVNVLKFDNDLSGCLHTYPPIDEDLEQKFVAFEIAASPKKAKKLKSSLDVFWTVKLVEPYSEEGTRTETATIFNPIATIIKAKILYVTLYEVSLYDKETKTILATEKIITDPEPVNPNTNLVNPIIKVDTDFGIMRIQLYPEKAKCSVDRFLHYVDSSFYVDTVIHSIYNPKGIFGGVYSINLQKKSITEIACEEKDSVLPIRRGSFAIRYFVEGGYPNTEFFLSVSDLESETLSSEYVVIGYLQEGLELIDQLVKTPTIEIPGIGTSVPKTPVRLLRLEKEY
jgi:cyclophilin family peptidyl-prolyl cis-trans isomerase